MSSPRDDDEHEYPAHLRGSFAFSEKASHADLSERCINGAVFKVTTAAERGTEADAELMFTESEVPLVLFRADKTLEVITDSTKVSIGDGDSILSLVSA